jgi:RES domain
LPELRLVAAPERVWRVGFDDAWKWTPWEYATDGRFSGRWDDLDGIYRVLYAGSSLLACLTEVLAVFRPDPKLADALDGIGTDLADAAYDILRPGEIPRSWLQERCVGSAHLAGRFVDIEHSSSISALRPLFIDLAVNEFDLPDYDAAVLRMSAPRRLTQMLSSHLYRVETSAAGIRYRSRHGSDLELWAVFERSGIHPVTAEAARVGLTEDLPEITMVLELHRLEFV